MTKTDKASDVQHISYCAIDRQGRIAYLGSSESEAERFRAGGAIVRSGSRLGDAMRTASMDYGSSVQQRRK
jgi:hypothetical protein